MTSRILAALPLLLSAVVGCVEQRAMLVTPGGQPVSQTSLRPSSLLGPRIPPHEAVARRVLAVGGKLIDANPQAGVRPLFITVGQTQPEIMHTGGGTRGYQVAISQGLVEACETDAQLAAVLALELGKIVTEREAGRRTPTEPSLPPDVAIGNDSGGTFGPPDGTRHMELARLDPKRRPPAPAPTPDALARKYLEKAGHDLGALTEVAVLLRKAEGNHDMEGLVRPLEPAAPTAAKLGTPRPAERAVQRQ